MIVSWLPLLLASAATAGVLPSRQSLTKRASLGPIDTGSPSGIVGGEVKVDAPPVSSFFDGLKPPFPTNTWWASYAADPGNAVAAGPFPYESQLDGNGVKFGFSVDREFDGTSIKQPTHNDWRVSFAEHEGSFSNHKATAFDTQTVTIRYFQGGASMDAYLVPGSPYITFEYDGATPLLTAMNGGIKSFNGKTLSVGDSSSETGTEFTVTDTEGATYLIYALSSLTLTAKSASSNKGTIQADGTFSGVLRVVYLSDPSHKDLLDSHYQIYPTSANLDYSLSDSSGSIIFNWETVGDGSKLLMLTWPHHRLTMKNPNFPDTSALGYLTTKGWMYPAIGNEWTMDYELSSITWDAPRDLDSSCSASVTKGLEYEIGLLDPSDAPNPGDFYYWGGTLAAQARLALIADDLGKTDLANAAVDYLKASFNHWFDGSSNAVPAYETAWGGVISKAGASDPNVDFGNGFYNDHHFHYGYFLTVAAVIARFDNGWLNQHKEFINWFARDIINPSTEDPYFPVVRCRDWFAGHSWASGIANGAGSRDQESSGEAVNGYYGALLWADVALSQDYVNFAKLMLASEQHGAQVYWHLYPSQSATDRDNPYPEQEMRELISMGNVEDWQSGAWLFWGDQKVEIAAIQILPLIPSNEVLYDKEWVENVWDYTMPELVDPSYGDEWKCVIIAAYSNSNPQVAAEWSSKLTSWGSGNTYTNELYFIGTRPNSNGSPICSELPENPYGTFKIQAVGSGNFVTASAGSPGLVASSSQGDAPTFTSDYVPNAGTLQLDSTKKYVSADQSGTSTISAGSDKASTWERFTIRPKEGAGSGVYSIKAASNGKYVTVSGDGSLVNGGQNESDSAGFRFVQA